MEQQATISNTDLSKFHKVNVADIIKEGKHIKPLFSSKYLTDNDNPYGVYYTGFYDAGVPMTISIFGNEMQICMPFLNSSDVEPLYDIEEKINAMHFGNELFINVSHDTNFINELYVDFYSRELKLFNDELL